MAQIPLNYMHIISRLIPLYTTVDLWCGHTNKNEQKQYIQNENIVESIGSYFHSELLWEYNMEWSYFLLFYI